MNSFAEPELIRVTSIDGVCVRYVALWTNTLYLEFA